jgi:hypothetical protein
VIGGIPSRRAIGCLIAGAQAAVAASCALGNGD